MPPRQGAKPHALTAFTKQKPDNTELNTTKEKLYSGLSIFHKLLLWFIGFTIFIVITSSVVHSIFDKKMIEDQLKKQFKNSLKTSISYFNSAYATDINHDLAFLESADPLNNITLGNDGKNSSPELKGFLSGILRANHNYLSIRFLNAKGEERIIANSAKNKNITAYMPEHLSLDNDIYNKKTKELFSALKNSPPGTIMFAGPFKYENKHTFLAGINKRKPVDGTFGGAIILHCDLSIYMEYLSKIKMFDRHLMWVFDSEYKVLLSPPNWNKQPFSLDNPVETSFFFFEKCRLSPNSPDMLTIVLSAPPDIFRDQVKEAALISFLIALALTAIATIAAFFISRQFSRPINELVDSTLLVSNGNLDAKATVNTGGEIRLLAETFNKMTKELKSSAVSRDYVDRVFYYMRDSIIVASTEGVIQTVNFASCEILGYKEEELLGRSLKEIVKEGSKYRELWFDSLIETAFVSNIEKVYLTKKGKSIDVLFSGSVMFNETGKIQGIICAAQDITERKKTERALKESEERYAMAARGANDGLWDWNLAANTIYYSSRWKLMLGYKENEIGSSHKEWLGRIHHKDIAQFENALEAHLGRKRSNFKLEYRIRHKDGRYIWILSRGEAVWNDKGEAYRISGSNTDITERKQVEQQLEHNVFHDPLTRIPNRALFVDRLEQALKYSQRNNDYMFAVLLLDLDRFKVVNDSLGHLAGDKLLRLICARLKSIVRGEDTLARLGGDEFAILLNSIKNVFHATRVAERIESCLKAPFTINGNEVFTSASIGIAQSRTGYQNSEDILRDADTAMYSAKMLGKSRYKMFDAEMHEKAVKILKMEASLRKAIEKGGDEFQLHYQPIFSLNTGRIVSAEALIRWTDPVKGPIPPLDFIPLAEETGIIVPLGEWILKTACAQSKSWKNENFSDVTIAVNFSGRQFIQHNLVEKVSTTLQEAGLNPDSLDIEITETVAVEDVEHSFTMLNEFKNLGVKISIDDFGTGYSSMGYLKRFKASNLKIDRSFISDISKDPDAMEIVKAIIALAHSLRLQVIAEGVETESQLEFLRDLGCDKVQGFLLSKPVPGEDFLRLLQNGLSATSFFESPPRENAADVA